MSKKRNSGTATTSFSPPSSSSSSSLPSSFSTTHSKSQNYNSRSILASSSPPSRPSLSSSARTSTNSPPSMSSSKRSSTTPTNPESIYASSISRVGSPQTSPSLNVGGNGFELGRAGEEAPISALSPLPAVSSPHFSFQGPPPILSPTSAASMTASVIPTSSSKRGREKERDREKEGRVLTKTRTNSSERDKYGGGKFRLGKNEGKNRPLVTHSSPSSPLASDSTSDSFPLPLAAKVIPPDAPFNWTTTSATTASSSTLSPSGNISSSTSGGPNGEWKHWSNVSDTSSAAPFTRLVPADEIGSPISEDEDPRRNDKGGGSEGRKHSPPPFSTYRPSEEYGGASERAGRGGGSRVDTIRPTSSPKQIVFPLDLSDSDFEDEGVLGVAGDGDDQKSVYVRRKKKSAESLPYSSPKLPQKSITTTPSSPGSPKKHRRRGTSVDMDRPVPGETPNKLPHDFPALHSRSEVGHGTTTRGGGFWISDDENSGDEEREESDFSHQSPARGGSSSNSRSRTTTTRPLKTTTASEKNKTGTVVDAVTTTAQSTLLGSSPISRKVGGAHHPLITPPPAQTSFQLSVGGKDVGILPLRYSESTSASPTTPKFPSSSRARDKSPLPSPSPSATGSDGQRARRKLSKRRGPPPASPAASSVSVRSGGSGSTNNDKGKGRDREREWSEALSSTTKSSSSYPTSRKFNQGNPSTASLSNHSAASSSSSLNREVDAPKSGGVKPSKHSKTRIAKTTDTQRETGLSKPFLHVTSSEEDLKTFSSPSSRNEDEMITPQPPAPLNLPRLDSRGSKGKSVLLDLAKEFLKLPSNIMGQLTSNGKLSSAESSLPHPLAALLFLLETMSFLRNLPYSSSYASSETTEFSESDNQPVGLGLDMDPTSRSSAEKERKSEEKKRREAREAKRETEKNEELENLWKTWRAFLEETYLYPSPLEFQRFHSIAPLYSSSVPGLPRLPPSTVQFRGSQVESVLKEICDCVGDWVEGVLVTLKAQSKIGLHPPDATLVSLLVDAGDSTFPIPDAVVQQAVSQMLNRSRQNASAHHPRPDLTWVLASRLEHFFGSENFAQAGFGRDFSGGHLRYSLDQQDNLAIKNFFPKLPSDSISSASDSESDPDGDSRLSQVSEDDFAASARKKSVSVSKRDEKLKWLLGPSYSPNLHGPAASTLGVSIPDHPARIRRGSAPSSPGRSDWDGGSSRSLSEGVIIISHRVSQGSSSGGTPSTATPRGWSEGTKTPTNAHPNGSAPTSKGKRDDGSSRRPRRLSGSVYSVPLHHARSRSVATVGDSEAMSMRSYNSAAPLILHTNSRGSEDALSIGSGSSSNQLLHHRKLPTYGGYENRLELPPVHARAASEFSMVRLPPTFNLLSNEEKSMLVRRSRKLQAMLGETLGEEEVELGLLGVKGQPSLPDLELSQEESNQLSAQFSSATSSALLKASRRSSFPPSSPTHSLGSLSRRPEDKSLQSSPDGSSPSSLVRTNTWNAVNGKENSRAGVPPMMTQRQVDSHLATGGRSEHDAKDREERRRKLVKLSRYLGERVPVEALYRTSNESSELPNIPLPANSRSGSGSNQNSLNRNASLLGSGILGKRFGLPRRKKGSANASPELPSAEWDQFTMGRERSAPPTSISSETPGENRDIAFGASTSLGGGTTAEFRRAKKLEHMFGEAPPKALLNPTPSSPPPHLKVQPSQHRKVASTSSAVRRLSGASAYRTSVASLLHLVTHNPEDLEEVTSVYIDGDGDLQAALSKTTKEKGPVGGGDDVSDDSESRSSAAVTARTSIGSRPSLTGGRHSDFHRSKSEDIPSSSRARPDPFGYGLTTGNRNHYDDSDDDMEELGGHDGIPPTRRSVSSESSARANMKRAGKLAKFFGTTEGEIFKSILVDLEEAVQEEAISDGERTAVLSSIGRIKQESGV